VLLLASLALRLKHAILTCFSLLSKAESMAAVRSRAGLDTPIPMGTEGQDGLVCITIIDV